MNPALISILKWIGVWFGFIMIFLLIINFILKGLLFKLIKVKASRGRLVAIRAFTPIDTYFRTGHVEDDALVFKNRQKEKIRVVMDKSLMYRFLGTNWVDWDERTSCIVRPSDFTIFPAFSHAIYNNLIVRALTRPSQLNKKVQILLIIVIIIAVLVIVNIFLSAQTYKIVKALGVVK